MNEKRFRLQTYTSLNKFELCAMIIMECTHYLPHSHSQNLQNVDALSIHISHSTQYNTYAACIRTDIKYKDSETERSEEERKEKTTQRTNLLNERWKNSRNTLVITMEQHRRI